MNERALLLMAEQSIRFSWIAALLLLLASLPAAVRALRGEGWKPLFPWLLVGLAALVLRLIVEPSFVHENRHGEMMYLRLLVGGHFFHGAGWFETYRLPLALSPSADTVFATSAILGAAACIVTGLFAITVAGATRGEALCAALILAFLPAHIHVSASESPLVLAALLTAASATAVSFGRRTSRPSLVWAGFLLSVVLAQIRPIYMVFPLLLAALAIITRPEPGAGQRASLAAAIMVTGTLLLPRALTIMFFMADDTLSSLWIHHLTGHLLTEANIVLNPRLFPIALTSLGVVGLALLFRRDPKAAAWLAVVVALLTCWFLLIMPNLGAILRFQHSILFIWVVLAAKGGLAVARAPEGAWARIVTASALILATVATAIPGCRILTHRFDKDIELHWLETEARAALPDSGWLVLPENGLGDGRILVYFLREVLPKNGQNWTIIRQSSTGPLHPALVSLDENVFYYRGLWAFEFTAAELPSREHPSGERFGRYRANPFYDHERTSPGVTAWTATEESMMRPEIVELESRLSLEPVPGLPSYSFAARPYHRWIVPQREPVIGFYRVTDALSH